MKNDSKEEINDRIKLMIQLENLNSKKFAEKTGVTSSTIYNIIDGTSKPGFDVLEKILIAFPEYNETWIILGTGKKKKELVHQSMDLSFGERVINEILGLKEQLAIKDKQIDKLLDIVSLVGKDDVSKKMAPVCEINYNDEIILDSKVIPMYPSKRNLLTVLLTQSANS